MFLHGNCPSLLHKTKIFKGWQKYKSIYFFQFSQTMGPVQSELSFKVKDMVLFWYAEVDFE